MSVEVVNREVTTNGDPALGSGAGIPLALPDAAAGRAEMEAAFAH